MVWKCSHPWWRPSQLETYTESSMGSLGLSHNSHYFVVIVSWEYVYANCSKCCIFLKLSQFEFYLVYGKWIVLEWTWMICNSMTDKQNHQITWFWMWVALPFMFHVWVLSCYLFSWNQGTKSSTFHMFDSFPRNLLSYHPNICWEGAMRILVCNENWVDVRILHII